MDIVPFKIVGHIVDNNGYKKPYMDREQEECFRRISQLIDENTFVDVGESVDYLYVYISIMFQELLPYYYTKESPSYSAFDKAHSFIDLYQVKYPEVTDWVFIGMICWEAVFCFDNKVIKKELNRYLDFCNIHPIDRWQRDGIISLMYLRLYDVSPETKIPYTLFETLFAKRLHMYMTDIGLNMQNEIIGAVEDILNEDFRANHINYLFRLFDFKPGSISVNKSSPYYFVYATNEMLNSPWNPKFSGDITYKEMQQRSGSLYFDGFNIPDNTCSNKKRDEYLRVLVREAEDAVRIKKDIPKVGEGWASETLLFYRIKCAFKDDVVYQHYSPDFLGRQHYDVYLPNHKIAIEYQGEQHFMPIDIFGGDEGLAINKERDAKKRKISKENGVFLIEVQPDYDLKELIQTICNKIYSTSDREVLNNKIVECVNLANAVNTINADKTSKRETIGINIKQKLNSSDSENKIRDTRNKIADEIAYELVSKLIPSKYADDHLSITDKHFFDDEYIYKEADRIKKEDPDKALELCLGLISNGHYKAPVVFERAAIVLRSQKRTDEELQLLLQMKCDLGYNNYDERIRKLILLKYKKEIDNRLNKMIEGF